MRTPAQPDSPRRSARRYDASGASHARAAATQLEIVGAAHDLFIAKGYAATTVGDIAAAAGVSAPTIFTAFGTKAGILKRCIDVALAGDPADVAVADRPLSRGCTSPTTPSRCSVATPR